VRLRGLVFLVGGLETAAFLALLVLLDPFGASDPLGRAISVGLSGLVATAYAALVVPALLLAAWNRFLPVALALALLAPVALCAVLRFA